VPAYDLRLLTEFAVPAQKTLQRCRPTSKEPIKPGPRVNATALISFLEIPAFLIASATTGMIFLVCSLPASSGTTPPYCSCIFWLAVRLETTFPSMHTAADVSSQDDSIANMTISGIIFGYFYRILATFYTSIEKILQIYIQNGFSNSTIASYSVYFSLLFNSTTKSSNVFGSQSK
jgi:hypothetical protein